MAGSFKRQELLFGFFWGGCQLHRGVVEACSCKAGGCRLAVRDISRGSFCLVFLGGERVLELVADCEARGKTP